MSAYRTPSPPPVEVPQRDWRLAVARAWLAANAVAVVALLAWAAVVVPGVAWGLLALAICATVCGSVWVTLWALGYVAGRGQEAGE